MRSPAIPNAFDITPSEIAALERRGGGRQPIRLVELEEPVDLVREQVDAGGHRARPSSRPTPAAVGSVPVGLCGALTTTTVSPA